MQKLGLLLFLSILFYPLTASQSIASAEEERVNPMPSTSVKNDKEVWLHPTIHSTTEPRWISTHLWGEASKAMEVMEVMEATAAKQLYDEMQLEGEVDQTAFLQAWTGYQRITEKKKPILTLIDFTKPSTEERLFVFDLEQKKLLFTSVVAHGKNSGGNYATSFSNKVGSYQSSLGFYLTGHTYQGRNGYSLLLDGLEKGINDRARERAIVVHGAAYANPSVCRSGRLGRSFGCPALPQALTRPIINAIKDGSVLFIYANQPEYNQHSTIL